MGRRGNKNAQYTIQWSSLAQPAVVAGLFILAALHTTIRSSPTDCPVTSGNGFHQCARVYYSVTGFGASEYGQILNALDAWTASNRFNKSVVEYIQGSPPPDATLYATLAIQSGYIAIQGAVAKTNKSPETVSRKCTAGQVGCIHNMAQPDLSELSPNSGFELKT